MQPFLFLRMDGICGRFLWQKRETTQMGKAQKTVLKPVSGQEVLSWIMGQDLDSGHVWCGQSRPWWVGLWVS